MTVKPFSPWTAKLVWRSWKTTGFSVEARLTASASFAHPSRCSLMCCAKSCIGGNVETNFLDRVDIYRDGGGHRVWFSVAGNSQGRLGQCAEPSVFAADQIDYRSANFRDARRGHCRNGKRQGHGADRAQGDYLF